MAFETRTRWEDAGYDCDHCGGEILIRTDELPGQATHSFYQCRRCSCQWSLSGELVRAGRKQRCPRPVSGAWRWPAMPHIPHIVVWLVAVLILLFIFTRLAGPFLVRYVVPLLFIAIVVYIVARLGRQQHWW